MKHNKCMNHRCVDGKVPINEGEGLATCGQCALHRADDRNRRLQYQLDALAQVSTEVLEAFDAGADGEAELAVSIDMMREQLRLLRDGL